MSFTDFGFLMFFKAFVPDLKASDKKRFFRCLKIHRGVNDNPPNYLRYQCGNRKFKNHEKIKHFENFWNFEEINKIFRQFFLLISLFKGFENIIPRPLLPASRHF